MHNNIDCSILLVSRPNWSNGLKRTLQSLVNTTFDTSNIEIMLKIDHNASIATYNVLQYYQKLLPIKPIVMDGLLKRAGVPIYSNTLAWNSSGKLLWWWSDEVAMQTANWNIHIKEWANRCEQPLLMYDRKKTTFYPCITRRLHNIIGRFTGHICLDSFLELVFWKTKGMSLINQLGPLYEQQLQGLEIMHKIDIETHEFKDYQHEVESMQTLGFDNYVSCEDMIPVDNLDQSKQPITHTDLNNPRCKTLLSNLEEYIYQKAKG